MTGSLPDRLSHWAAARADDAAFVYLADGATDERVLSWGALDRRSRAVGAAIEAAGAGGQRIILALPSGLDFVEALVGCWRAGAIPVPISLPRHRRVRHRLHRVASDCGATAIIGASDTRDRLDGEGAEQPVTSGRVWIDIDTIDRDAAGEPTGAADQPIALLQYTSGSTGDPKGVVITHTNLAHNSAVIAGACGHEPGETIAGWLPLYHDMGLIGLVMQAIHAGVRCVMMSPERFLMRPWLWLKMIDRYDAVSSPAPNFAYDLCVKRIKDEHKAELDLSRWRNALNGSEPIRAGTLGRFVEAFAGCGFDPAALLPCYGLAEATLMVTGGGKRSGLTVRDASGRPVDGAHTDEAGSHVGCGGSGGGLDVAIVDPETLRRGEPGGTGEVWVAGDSMADGYWNQPEATQETFGGAIADEPDGRRWLRTGDLGFIADGELFVTGRLKELVIIAGRNHYPVDLERTAEAAHDALAGSSSAAFAVDTDTGEALVIVMELDRVSARADIDIPAIERAVAAAVAESHELTPREVVVLRPGGLIRTTSGKVRRSACRDAYLNRTLDRYEASTHAGP